MKKFVTFVILTFIIPAFSYAAGPPVQPVPNVKGCWSGTAIVTGTGGSAPSSNGMPGPGAGPFYWGPGRKLLNQFYLKVDFQSGSQIKGIYYCWLGPIPCPPGGNCGFFEFSFEGYVNGNIFQLYTYTDDSPYNHKEQQRYLTGIIAKDSEGNKAIYGMGIGSRDMAQNPDYHSWQNIVFTFTLKHYEGSCDQLPDPTAEDSIGGFSCPWQGCPLP